MRWRGMPGLAACGVASSPTIVIGCWQCGQSRVAVGSSGSWTGACRRMLERAGGGGGGGGGGNSIRPGCRAIAEIDQPWRRSACASRSSSTVSTQPLRRGPTAAHADTPPTTPTIPPSRHAGRHHPKGGEPTTPSCLSHPPAPPGEVQTASSAAVTEPGSAACASLTAAMPARPTRRDDTAPRHLRGQKGAPVVPRRAIPPWGRGVGPPGRCRRAGKAVDRGARVRACDGGCRSRPGPRSGPEPGPGAGPEPEPGSGSDPGPRAG